MTEKTIICPNCDARMFSTTKAKANADSLVGGILFRPVVMMQGAWTCGVCETNFFGGQGYEAELVNDEDILFVDFALCAEVE